MMNSRFRFGRSAYNEQEVSCARRRSSGIPSLLACCWTFLLLSRPFAHGAGAEDFLARIYTNSSGKTLPYRLLPPKDYEPKQAYPIVLYLHGAAGRGEDNAAPLNWGPLLFLEPALREKHQFFLLVPQCPDKSSWLDLSWGGLNGYKESEPLRLALQLTLEILPTEFKLDPKRRYLTGVSMGGHAVWVLLVRQPGLFAAAVPVCSGGSARTVTDAAARCPVWAFHSDDDHLVPVQQVRDLVTAWREHGGTAKYTEYKGLKHSSWKRAYTETEMFDWLFQQKLPPPFRG